MNFKKIYILIISFLQSVISVENLRFSKLDNRGGLVLPFDGKTCNDEDWLEYNRLKIDDAVKSITPNDLPGDFSDEACRLVDEFRRKTVNEYVEWLLYFDYKTGEVIYCWKGQKNSCRGIYNKIHLIKRNIASIHSHPNCYSFPSPDNFDILENDFEDYEVITSINTMWIVEFKGAIQKKDKENFQFKLGDDMEDMIEIIKSRYEVLDVNAMIENIIGNYLLSKIDKEINNIKLALIKKELN